MKLLTKTAITGTCLSLVALYVTSGVTQSLETDGNRTLCIISWNIPFYGSVQVPHWAWWTFVKIWLFSVSTPVVLWTIVGLRELASAVILPVWRSRERLG